LHTFQTFPQQAVAVLTVASSAEAVDASSGISPTKKRAGGVGIGYLAFSG